MTLLQVLTVLVASFNVVYAHHKSGHMMNSTSSSASTAADVATTSQTTETATTTFAFTSSTTSQESAQTSGSTKKAGGDNTNTNGATIALDSSNLQTASDSDGFANIEAGQTPSLTDNANFINFCSGQRLTNGTQVTSGSCNGIVMGQIPASDKMISTIITNPAPGDNIAANQDFTVNIQVSNLQAGTFTNPNTTYYSAPQALKNGQVIGHSHITIQTLGNNIATSTPPDASKFVFFKGVNDAGDGRGGLSAVVTGGLPAGVYRVCTMTSSSNHQPVLMPVAQRGAQDDCTKFTVSEASGSTNVSGGNGSTVTSTTGSRTSTAKNSKSSATEVANANVVTFVREGGLRFSKRKFVA